MQRRTRMIVATVAAAAALTIAACSPPDGGTPTNVAPTGSLVASAARPPVGTAVEFDATGSSDVDGTIVSYRWDFGDGSEVRTTTGAVTSHTYDRQGTYLVRLIVTDDDGATSLAVLSVSVVSGV